MNRKAKNTSHVASSKTQSYSCACAYAIQVSPVGNKESDGLATFLHDDGGETVWIGQSLFFGTAEQALVNGCS